MVTSNTDKTVTIVGSGIVGICCALSLAKRGIPVRLIDRAAPGQATSYGNAGVISPWSFIPMALPGIWKKAPGMMLSADRPLAVRPEFWPRMLSWGSKFISHSGESTVRNVADAMAYLCTPSIELFRQHLQGTGHEDLLTDSWYVHAFRDASKPTLDALDYRIRLEKGGELELVTADELRQLEPALAPEFKAAVLIKGQARALSPGKMAEVLVQKAQALGVEFINFEARVIQREQQHWVIKGATESLQADQIILSAGVWSKQLLEPLGVKLPLVAERGYHMQFAEAGVTINNSIMDVDAKVVASSMSSGVRLAGAAEFADAEARPDVSRQELLTRQAKFMFPDLAVDQPSFWMGRRPSLPDSLPVLGPISGQEGLFAAFGHSHYGLMMAPQTGEVLADFVTGQESVEDVAAFSCERFF